MSDEDLRPIYLEIQTPVEQSLFESKTSTSSISLEALDQRNAGPIARRLIALPTRPTSPRMRSHSSPSIL